MSLPRKLSTVALGVLTLIAPFGMNAQSFAAPASSQAITTPVSHDFMRAAKQVVERQDYAAMFIDTFMRPQTISVRMAEIKALNPAEVENMVAGANQAISHFVFAAGDFGTSNAQRELAAEKSARAFVALCDHMDWQGDNMNAREEGTWLNACRLALEDALAQQEPENREAFAAQVSSRIIDVIGVLLNGGDIRNAMRATMLLSGAAGYTTPEKLRTALYNQPKSERLLLELSVLFNQREDYLNAFRDADGVHFTGEHNYPSNRMLSLPNPGLKWWVKSGALPYVLAVAGKTEKGSPASWVDIGGDLEGNTLALLNSRDEKSFGLGIKLVDIITAQAAEDAKEGRAGSLSELASTNLARSLSPAVVAKLEAANIKLPVTQTAVAYRPAPATDMPKPRLRMMHDKS